MTPARLLLAGGQVVTASRTFQADVLVEDGRIRAVGLGLSADAAQTVDVAGQYLLPGGVDVHTHLNLRVGANRVADGYAEGSLAAIMGGTTTVIEHPGFGPAGCPLFSRLTEESGLARDRMAVDYGFHAVLQHAGADAVADVARLAERGFPSAKAYLTYDGRLDDESLLTLMRAMAEHGVLCLAHAESHAMVSHLAARHRALAPADPRSHALSRPPLAEAEAVRRLISLAEIAGCPLYIVHLSTALGLAAVAEAKERGLPVYAETCPQYLLLTDERYAGPDGLAYVMAPPLRAPSDVEALWRGLATGVIDVVATDHCAFSLADKTRLGAADVFACPGGAPGVETRLALLYSAGVARGRLSLERFVDLCATSPARLFGLSGRKGEVSPGLDADLVVLDPRGQSVLRAASLRQKCDYSPFEGLPLHGRIRHVLLRGRLAVRDGELLAAPGDGRFVARDAWTGS